MVMRLEQISLRYKEMIERGRERERKRERGVTRYDNDTISIRLKQGLGNGSPTDARMNDDIS